MYIELTPEDTVKDLQNLLIDALPGFEFPRVDLYDYETEVVAVEIEELVDDDFILGPVWGDLTVETSSQVIVDKSHFNIELTPEEINIIAILMKQGWVQRQVNSIEHTRMKYTGADFKGSSQANHLSKLMTLLDKSKQDSIHMQRLYKRRKPTGKGYSSNWSCLRETSALDEV